MALLSFTVSNAKYISCFCLTKKGSVCVSKHVHCRSFMLALTLIMKRLNLLYMSTIQRFRLLSVLHFGI